MAYVLLKQFSQRRDPQQSHKHKAAVQN